MLSKEAGPALGQWTVCDNIDLATVLQEYEAYCYVKFKKFPKIAKRRTGNGKVIRWNSHTYLVGLQCSCIKLSGILSQLVS